MKEIRLTDDHAYKAGFDNLQSLRKRRDELHRTITAELAKPRKSQPHGADLVVGLPAQPVDNIANISKLQAESLKLDNAIKLQEHVLRSMTSDIARRLCKQVAPEYRRRLAVLAEALTTAGEAADALRDFVSFYDGQCGVPVTGIPVVGINCAGISAVNPQSTSALLVAKVNQAIGQMDAAMPPAPVEMDPAAASSRRPARR